jgi:ankyrin repeat protein
MLELGANVNQRDSSGLFALKYALIRRDGPAIDKLVNEYKADVNLPDLRGRNLLHHAINMSSATADASFESEQQLIDLGININHRDDRLRTPLHYAFVKIKDWRNTAQIDPIETVSSLCGCRGLEVEVEDKWQKTPLHYAA